MQFLHTVNRHESSSYSWNSF